MNILFVCTGNIARSPAAEAVMRRISNGAHDTRSAGISPYSPRPLSGEDIRWAEVIGVMEEDHRAFILERWAQATSRIRVLGIPDLYRRHDPELTQLLEVKLAELLANLPGDHSPRA